MHEIERVAILGAGAMGAVLASRFNAAPSFSTCLIARGVRRDRLIETGLTVNRETFFLPVIDPAGAQTPVDLILVGLKHHHLPEAVPGLDRLVGPETIFISVMNGLDSETTIGSLYGRDKVLMCVAVGIDALRQEGKVTYTTLGKLQFGEADNTRISDRVARVQSALDRAGIPHETPADMLRVLWWKFMVNVGVNQASAMMRAPYGVFHTEPDARAVMFGLMREVLALAACEGIHLEEPDLAAWDAFLQTLSPQGKTSMLQDIDAGRKTEVEIFAGKAVELGRTHGIPTPMNEMALHVIRTLESTAG
ncbi:MAG: 2-dehydropantoate 2-reductase [Anaerolineae bacterium]|nr:2-dehydropantoate 2-reductase [Anaerolineae bacterium]